MSAKRSTSTTSLARYARAVSPSPESRSLDFCNAFWGIADGGVDVLFARMRGATRTMEELKNFWKERATIEEDYAKRLTKLGKMVLGRDEIGDLKNSLETVRSETERQAAFHSNLAQQIRTEFEVPVTTFFQRQLQHKKTYQVAIEKEFKTKQTQESYVNKAREKYEQDCLRINSFTAQASLVQGKDLEKINLKLERTHQTVQSNEREFANLAKVLQETVQKWEHDWKRFCDSCQDLEDQRLEFMKDNLWSYANAVSTVCVNDDESCEKIRVSLEQMEPEREMEIFVRDYGTGNQIPDPPAFVNYQAPDAVPSSSARPTYRGANFVRSSNRESPLRQPIALDEEPIVNTAGIGAGGHRRVDSYGPDSVDVSRRNTQISQQNHSSYTNGISGQHSPNQHPVISASPGSSPVSASPLTQPTRRQSGVPAQTPQQQLQRVLQDSYADPQDPATETYIRVGENTYKVDPTKDPQQQPQTTSRGAAAPPPRPTVGSDADPLMKQLEELKNTVSATGSVRRNTIVKPKTSTSDHPRPTHSAASSISNVNRQNTSGSALSPPVLTSSGGTSNRSPSPVRDYRHSAEAVIGTHPASRPPSPNPPIAAFMMPKSSQPPTSASVKDVVSDYQQSLPGEQKSLSRNETRNRRGSVNSSVGSHQQHNLIRPPSGHTGIGAHGGSRSNSPQPMMISRSSSPQPGQIVNRNSLMQPPVQTGSGIVRSPSPNSVGIALDPSGRVLHDEMAHRYQPQQQQQQQQPQPSPSTVNQPHMNMHQHQHQHQGRMGGLQIAPQVQTTVFSPAQPINTGMPVQRKPTYLSSPGGVQQYSPVTPPPSTGPMGMYHGTPSPQPYVAQQIVPPPPPPSVQQVYNPPPQVQYQPQPPRTVPQQQQQAPPPQHMHNAQMNPYAGGAGDVQRGSSLAYYWNQPQVQQVNVPPPQPQQAVVPPATTPVNPMLAIPQQQQVYQQHPPSQQQAKPQMQRTPSPPPTTEDGTPVLFYVRALYDYVATIDEEFDFQASDIIAVTSTPEDGWWTGELLDDSRRQKGRNVFPSNFVTFF